MTRQQAASHETDPDGSDRESRSRLLEEIDQLTRRVRSARDGALEGRLVELRERAFRHRPGSGEGRGWRAPVRDLFPEAIGPPEVQAEAFGVDALASGLDHHGCLVVRGLVGPAAAARLRDDVDRAFSGFEAHRQGSPIEETSPWYAPLDSTSGNGLTWFERLFLHGAGGVNAADAPRPFFDLLDILDDAGLLPVLHAYFGEPPVVSHNKCVLRRVHVAEPTWHQDGIYIGEQARAVNLWLALSRCGGETDAVGLDILPRRINGLVETGTDEAIDPRAIGPQMVQSLAGDRPVCRPVFEEGDALLFDQFFVHRSDVRRGLTRNRYAVESWFFAPSAAPSNQTLLVASTGSDPDPSVTPAGR